MIRILIVEDDDVGRKVLRLFMQSHGEAITAAHGEEALGIFYSAHQDGSPFTLILLDIGLPDLDGFEVLKEIRQFESNQQLTERAHVFILTGDGNKASIDKATALGASGYLLKPVIESELLTELSRKNII